MEEGAVYAETTGVIPILRLMRLEDTMEINIILKDNGGRCGKCGDNWSDPHPQAHDSEGILKITIHTLG